LHVVVVRDISNVEMIHNAAKRLRLLSPIVTDDRFKNIQHIGLLHMKILMFIYLILGL